MKRLGCPTGGTLEGTGTLSSPPEPLLLQQPVQGSRDISWVCRCGAGGKGKLPPPLKEDAGLSRRGGVSPDWESLQTAGRPQSGQKKMETRVPAWSGYLRGQEEDTMLAIRGWGDRCSVVDRMCCSCRRLVPESSWSLTAVSNSGGSDALLISGGIRHTHGACAGKSSININKS